MSIFDLSINHLDGTPGLMGEVKGKAALFVNVASKCGLTPQYTALEALHEKLAPQGFSVVGFPCNQFGGQEPGTPVEIAEFCSTNYNVTFPLAEKIDVNGAQRHPVYVSLTTTADGQGHDGDIRWNFEKFVVDRRGHVVARFAPPTAPDDPAVLEAIDRALAS
ncbi:MAG TPA: glutathione peroxidase [Acidimicrobiales bacterium]|jgi:glutathione peroxidase|nr:glutathione peroxidase [Acidimicrobiales bacterium]